MSTKSRRFISGTSRAHVRPLERGFMKGWIGSLTTLPPRQVHFPLHSVYYYLLIRFEKFFYKNKVIMYTRRGVSIVRVEILVLCTSLYINPEWIGDIVTSKYRQFLFIYCCLVLQWKTPFSAIIIYIHTYTYRTVFSVCTPLFNNYTEVWNFEHLMDQMCWPHFNFLTTNSIFLQA